MNNKEIDNSERPWGRYRVIEDNVNYKIKRIEVNPRGETILSISHEKSGVLDYN
jgi:mannose-6-phosphate isomerase